MTDDKAAVARERARASGRHPHPTSEGRSRNMRAIKRTDTKPEIRLRQRLHALGFRFRKDYRLDLPGGRVRPDVVFTRRKVAVFVDSCFWHVCPEHGRTPTSNDWYWTPKLRRNVERDRRADRMLAEADWAVVRVWEHEPPDEALQRVSDAVTGRAAACSTSSPDQTTSSTTTSLL
ncbi:DNA mismatch endonuclease (patch repair protein) [Prauserella sediminis]|uniref:DNA mismatch endonuclease (Patch repair protein) n=1 Tax=Prauserella sediminis TaxID=577680 RepID=A0A839XRU8_9PSEU|nr:very short patch repair endonuclease [Prauserella sediminis]MBB3662605.1 DNA mismatch endonuclease (patch repair protein) [Prauserella sediminis]